MADMENEEDLFADLYDGEADEPVTTTAPVKAEPTLVPGKIEPQSDSVVPDTTAQPDEAGDDFNIKTDFDDGDQQYAGGAMQGLDTSGQMGGFGDGGLSGHSEDRDRPIHIKDDG